ncbi:hypothetical protein AVEN_242600-1 [Araneus ventricosus]|uniref:Uncharacterized protein n=1 Tax=Araneus ventricosus TaxID=182803 RepID=A0A4Y2ETD2_ARAVE|nr:hypothetical protein AVEN_242600-1 [Araneus ventricosus]
MQGNILTWCRADFDSCLEDFIQPTGAPSTPPSEKRIHLHSRKGLDEVNLRICDVRIDTGRGDLVVRSRPRDRRPQAQNPIPPKIRRVWGQLHAKSYVVAKRPPAGVAWKFGEGGARSGVVLVI